MALITPRPNAKELIASLSDPFIESILEPAFSDIDTVASFLGIDEGYLSVQVRLLLAQFSKAELEAAGGVKATRTVLTKLRAALGDFEQHYKRHRDANRIGSIPPGAKVKGTTANLRIESAEESHDLTFGTVEPAAGLEVQREIHYIHKAREDTAYHVGLYVDDADFPVAYAALSWCDRDYQIAALQNALGLQDLSNRVIVMTRAYGYPPLPKNAMSKLFDQTARLVAAQTDARYIITALNPFLGFSGSIFLGSSYHPFATSPMKYRYTEQGLYANRRSGAQVVEQRYETPPILWLARGFAKADNRAIETCDRLVIIEEEEYSNG